jgi:hypothetical protein
MVLNLKIRFLNPESGKSFPPLQNSLYTVGILF